jgi:hypothetical protein
LKDRLLNNHSLTDFQKIERQFKMGELGPQQKPSELLTHLVELTPSDELESKYLIFLLIQRLPKILRMQLSDDLDLELRDISERAYSLWSIHANDTWRPQSPRWQRRSQRTGRAARPASLWPLTPPSTSRNGTRSTDAVITATRAAMLPPRPTGRLPVSAGSTGSGVRRPIRVPCLGHGRETNAPGMD